MLTKVGMCHPSGITRVVRYSKTTPQSAAQGYRSNMMLQLTMTGAGKTSDRLIQQPQYKWFGCSSAQSWMEEQKRNAFPWVTSVTVKNVEVQLDLVVCMIILQRSSEELEFIFSLKLWIHHQEVSTGWTPGCALKGMSQDPARGKCNLPALTLSADPRPRADGIQFQSTGSVIGRYGPEAV